MQVPADAMYGAQTARAVDNFPISGWEMPRELISAAAMIKQAAAEIHKEAGRLPADKADAIIAACEEVIDGQWDEHFPVDVFQTGSGTSTNMNVNEVIANRAAELLGGQRGDKSLVHPNDDVNRGQSSNDVIPSAVHVAAACALRDWLIPDVEELHEALAERAKAFDEIVKIARTHLMDAVPIRVGQELAGYAAQLAGALEQIDVALDRLCVLAIGGTAVGTGLNAPEGFGRSVCEKLHERLDLPFSEAENHVAAQASADVALQASAACRAMGLAMGKIASDLRLLGSGPRCGLGELILPAVQPGSSIMPGKVNPVLCESVIQTACQVVGCDAAIAAGATGGVGSLLELNVAWPMIASNLLSAISILSGAARAFNEKCIAGLEVNETRCRLLVEHSLAMVTALAPEIGYDQASDIAHEAYERGRTIREVCQQRNILPEEKLNELLDPRGQTGE
jgi:fumarate hydratase class II